MRFILPINPRDLARAAEDAKTKYQPNRLYDVEFVIRPRKRELSINIKSRDSATPPLRRFRYQILPFTKV